MILFSDYFIVAKQSKCKVIINKLNDKIKGKKIESIK